MKPMGPNWGQDKNIDYSEKRSTTTRWNAFSDLTVPKNFGIALIFDKGQCRIGRHG
jgi:hypothetical protein